MENNKNSHLLNTHNTLKVFAKCEESNINNHDIKWYLADEQLWITVYKKRVEYERRSMDKKK